MTNMRTMTTIRVFLLSSAATTTSVLLLSATTTNAVSIPPNYQHLTHPDVATDGCWLEEKPPSDGSSFFGSDRKLLFCHWTNRVHSAYQSNADLWMEWNATVSCPVPGSKTVEDYPTAKSMRKQAFDSWVEDECTCQVNEVIKYRENQAGQTEQVLIDADSCSCTMCPYGYGKNNLILDCSTPPTTGIEVQTTNTEPILDDCMSFDCNHGCNGDCGLTCDEAGPECCWCRDDCPEPSLWTQAPTTAAPSTAAPTPATPGEDDSSNNNNDPDQDRGGSNTPGSTAALVFGKWSSLAVAGLLLIVGVVL